MYMSGGDGPRRQNETVRRRIAMYAVKSTNLLVTPNTVCYTKSHDYLDACDIKRRIQADMEDMGDAWELGEDYTLEIVEVDDDFDFDNQPDWN